MSRLSSGALRRRSAAASLCVSWLPQQFPKILSSRSAQLGMRERLAERLHRRRRVLAAPLPVDAAQLVLPDLERAQRVVLRHQPAAHRLDRHRRVRAVAVGVEAADPIVGHVERLERALPRHHRLDQRHRPLAADPVAAEVELEEPHRPGAQRARQHRRPLLGEPIVPEAHAGDRRRRRAAARAAARRREHLRHELQIKVCELLAVHVDAAARLQLLDRQRVRRQLHRRQTRRARQRPREGRDAALLQRIPRHVEHLQCDAVDREHRRERDQPLVGDLVPREVELLEAGRRARQLGAQRHHVAALEAAVLELEHFEHPRRAQHRRQRAQPASAPPPPGAAPAAPARRRRRRRHPSRPPSPSAAA